MSNRLKDKINDIDFVSKILDNLNIKHRLHPNTKAAIRNLNITINESGDKDRGRIYVRPNGAFSTNGGSMPKPELYDSNVFYFLNQFHTHTSIDDLVAASGLDESQVKYYISMVGVGSNQYVDMEGELLNGKEGFQKELEVEYFWQVVSASKNVSRDSEYLVNRGISPEVVREEQVRTTTDSAALYAELMDINTQKRMLSIIDAREKRHIESKRNPFPEVRSREELRKRLKDGIDEASRQLSEIKKKDMSLGGVLPESDVKSRYRANGRLRALAEFKGILDMADEARASINSGRGLEFSSINRNKVESFQTMIPYKKGKEVGAVFMRKLKKDNMNKYTQIGTTFNEFKKKSPNRLVVCEGYLDYLTISTHHKKNPGMEEPSYLIMSKASAGLKKRDLDIIRSFNGNLTLLLDNDTAGRQVTGRIMEVVMEQGEGYLKNVVLGEKFFNEEGIYENDINDLYNEDLRLGVDRLGKVFSSSEKYKVSKIKNYEFVEERSLNKSTDVVLDPSKKYDMSEIESGKSYYIRHKKGQVIKLDSEDIKRYLWNEDKDMFSLFYKKQVHAPLKIQKNLPKNIEEFKQMLFASMKSVYPGLDITAPENEKLLERIKLEMDIIRQIHDNMQRNAQNSVGFLQYFFKNKILAEKLEEKGVVYDIRGSADNFLTLSLLGIIKDPIDNLKAKVDDELTMPERFLNPDQVDMPDIDFEVPDNKGAILDELRVEMNLYPSLKNSIVNGKKVFSDHPSKHFYDVPGTTPQTRVIPKDAKDLSKKNYLNVDLIKYGGVLNRYQAEFEKGGYSSFLHMREVLNKEKNISLFTILSGDLPHLTGVSKQNIANLNPEIKDVLPKVETFWFKTPGDEKSTMYVKDLKGDFVSMKNGSVLDPSKVNPSNVYSNEIMEIYHNDLILKNMDRFLGGDVLEKVRGIHIDQKKLTLASSLNRPFASKTTFTMEKENGGLLSFQVMGGKGEERVLSVCGNYEIEVNNYNKGFFLGNNKRLDLYRSQIKQLGNLYVPKLKTTRNAVNKDVVPVSKGPFANQIIDAINKNSSSMKYFGFLNQSGGYIIYQEQLLMFLRKVIRTNHGSISHETNRQINVLRKFVSKSDSKVSEEERQQAVDLIEVFKKEVLRLKDKKMFAEAIRVFNSQFSTFLDGPYLFSYVHAKHVGNQAQNVGWLIEEEEKEAFEALQAQNEEAAAHGESPASDEIEAQTQGAPVEGTEVQDLDYHSDAPPVDFYDEDAIAAEFYEEGGSFEGLSEEPPAAEPMVEVFQSITVEKLPKDGESKGEISSYTIVPGEDNLYTRGAGKSVEFIRVSDNVAKGQEFVEIVEYYDHSERTKGRAISRPVKLKGSTRMEIRESEVKVLAPAPAQTETRKKASAAGSLDDVEEMTLAQALKRIGSFKAVVEISDVREISKGFALRIKDSSVEHWKGYPFLNVWNDTMKRTTGRLPRELKELQGKDLSLEEYRDKVRITIIGETIKRGNFINIGRLLPIEAPKGRPEQGGRSKYP